MVVCQDGARLNRAATPDPIRSLAAPEAAVGDQLSGPFPTHQRARESLKKIRLARDLRRPELDPWAATYTAMSRRHQCSSSGVWLNTLSTHGQGRTRRRHASRPCARHLPNGSPPMSTRLYDRRDHWVSLDMSRRAGISVGSISDAGASAGAAEEKLRMLSITLLQTSSRL